MEKVYLLKAENPHALLEVLTKSDATGGYEIDEIGFDDPALVHLQRLVEAGYLIYDGMDDKGCYYCHGKERLTNVESSDGPWDVEFQHDTDCPWVAARAFLDRLNTPTAADAPSR